MNKKHQGRFPHFNGYIGLNKGILESQSWKELTRKEIDIFLYIFARLKYVNTGKKIKAKWEAKNNGDIKISMEKMRTDLGMAKDTSSKGVHKLIKIGLIRLTRVGSNKICHKYKVLYRVVDTKQERWRKYPEQNWEHECPKSPKNLIGRNTRFKTHPQKVD